MYVCVCNGVTEKQIRAAVDRGVTSISHLQDELGVATQCGSCLEHALTLISARCEPVLADEALFYSPA